MLVVRQARLEVAEAAEEEEEAEGAEAGRPGSVPAAGTGKGLFLAVRAKVRRFMTTVHADGFPTPID